MKNKVIAKLVATYDLSSGANKDVKSINYFCIYEYEYNGKKYRYREQKRDNFDTEEEIELQFDKDPNKAYRVNNKANMKMTKNEKLLTTIFFSVLLIIFIYFIIMSVKSFIKNPLISILILLLFVIVAIVSVSKSRKKKNFNQLLDEALSNNRFANAYLKKSQFLLHDNENSKQYYEKNIQYNHYKAKYEYEYNGKKYKTVFYFSNMPPSVIKVYFNKNPKDVFYYTV